MRKTLIGITLLAAFTFAAPASAGCWATVGLGPPPAQIEAGQVWTAEITVLQHGENPLPDAAAATPAITIVNGETGTRKTFEAKATDASKGFYEAAVVFPTAGTWRYEVFDGFTSWGGKPSPCAQTHTFTAVQVGGPSADAGGSNAAGTGGGSFPVWPLSGGLGALALAAVGLLYYRRRHGARAPAAV